MQSPAFSFVTPPRASTGRLVAATASASHVQTSGRQVGAFGERGEDGPKDDVVGSFSPAVRTSSLVWQETPIRKPFGTRPRQDRGAGEWEGRCTPAAPAARAMSTRELTRIGTRSRIGERHGGLNQMIEFAGGEVFFTNLNPVGSGLEIRQSEWSRAAHDRMNRQWCGGL